MLYSIVTKFIGHDLPLVAVVVLPADNETNACELANKLFEYPNILDQSASRIFEDEPNNILCTQTINTTTI